MLLVAVPFVLLFVGCSVIVGGVVNEVDNAVESASVASSNEVAGVIGKTVDNAGMRYTVNSVKVVATLDGFGEDLTPKAGASFVVVDLTLLNTKTETKIFDESTAVIRSSDGVEFSRTLDYTYDDGGKDLFLEQVQPNLATSGQIVFEIPTSYLAGSSVVIEDFWGNGEVVVPTQL